MKKILNKVLSKLLFIIAKRIFAMRKVKKLLQDKWYEENAPYGKDLGYPDCCIKEFCLQHPTLLIFIKLNEDDTNRYNASFIDGKYSGFIPCAHHAKQILSGTITLASLIKNRNILYEEFPVFENNVSPDFPYTLEPIPGNGNSGE